MRKHSYHSISVLMLLAHYPMSMIVNCTGIDRNYVGLVNTPSISYRFENVFKYQYGILQN